MTTLHLRNSISQLPLRRGVPVFLLALALALFALPRITKAADGGLANGNTAEGDFALQNLTTGGRNTALGFDALYFNTTGKYNTATGANTLVSNTEGSENTATGEGALESNTSGINNTATGTEAMHSNNIGSDNTATGTDALHTNTTGAHNTALGFDALFRNTGFYNTATGSYALALNTTGSNNIAVGYQAGFNLTTGSNNIDIGNQGVAGEAGKIRIGTAGKQTATFIAGISGVGVTGSPVLVSSTGKLGIMTSSARYKEAIKPMDKASEALLALKPVTFRYKEEVDPDGIPQFGLIAEQVEKVNPALVIRDEDGKVMTVRYEAINAMLLNEFLKEHRKVEEQGATIAQQQKQIEALAATVQKVSDQVALGKPAPQLAANGE